MRWWLVPPLLLAAACFPRGWTGVDPAAPLEPPFPCDVGPYLIVPEPGRAVIAFEHPLEEPPIVEWWPVATGTSAPPQLALYVEARSYDGIWAAQLDRLPLDVELRYRIRAKELTIGPFSFRAGISRGRPVRFAAFGDTRTGHQVHALLIQAMTKERIDFAINSGDLVEFGGTPEQWATFFRIESPLISRVPFLPVVGNHDDSPSKLYERYFLSDVWSQGRRYYYQDWGDLKMVVLDSQIEMRAGSAQYDFANRALADAAERGQLIAMSMHYPPYSSGEHGSNLEVREVVSELARRYGVELVLAGHDHNYERTDPIDGTTYVVAASAGATIRAVAPSAFTAEMRTEPHFVLFDVEAGTLVGRAINLAGNTFDTFVIPANPPRPTP
jgi:Icc-related predicted phosphoesterase